MLGVVESNPLHPVHPGPHCAGAISGRLQPVPLSLLYAVGRKGRRHGNLNLRHD